MFLITHFAADYTPVTVNINILLFFGIFTALPNSFKLKFLHYILEYALNKLKWLTNILQLNYYQLLLLTIITKLS